jgi:hypothetical protein
MLCGTHFNYRRAFAALRRGTAPTCSPKPASTATGTDADDRRAEAPVDDNNHALGAVRYLVSRLDERKMAMWKSGERREMEGDADAGRMAAG